MSKMMDVEEVVVKDPYDFLKSPLICKAAVHAKAKKNCVKNPFCVYGFGDRSKQGIYKNPCALLADLGDDPCDLERQGVTKKSKLLRPVGLKNLGATCYLNVLIQSLFQNVLIRDAVLNFVPSSSVESRKTVMDDVMEALQGAFSHMILSKKNVYSLSHFVRLLGLDAGEQQDPQEFNKLFMGKLEGSKIKVLQVERKSIAQLLEGKEAYSTVCSECKTESRRTQAFRELELKIDGLKSIDQAVELHFASEDLTGENMYFCSKCNCKRDAVRHVEIEEAPPVLTIDLMRYVYDLKTYSKVKLKTSVRFEEKTNFRGEDYRLVSVLYHKGRSAYGGHYVAETLEWATEQWWHCDDVSILPCASPVRDLPPVKESVVEVMDISDSPIRKNGKGSAKVSKSKKKHAARKRKRKGDEDEDEEKEDDVDGEAEEEIVEDRDEEEGDSKVDSKIGEDDDKSSPKSVKKGKKPAARQKATPKKGKKKGDIDLDRAKDAYCFSYVKESVFQTAINLKRIPPSDSASEEVSLNDKMFAKEIVEYKEKKSTVEAEIKERKETYMALVDELAVKSLDEIFHFVPISWLQQWVLGEKNKSLLQTTAASATNNLASGGDGRTSPIVINLEQQDASNAANGTHDDANSDGKAMVIGVDDIDSPKKEEIATIPPRPGVFSEPVANIPFMCPHSSIDGGVDKCFPSIPALQTKLKAISDKAYREIVKECDVDWTSANYRCPKCFQEASSESQSMQDLGETFSSIIEQIEGEGQAPDYEIPTKWVTALKREVTALLDGKKGAIDNRVTSELLCKHNLRDPETRKRTTGVCTATWDAIVKVFPNAVPLLRTSQDCRQCQQENNELCGTQNKVKEIRCAEMERGTELKPLTAVTAPRYPEVFDDKVALMSPLSDNELSGQTFYAVDEKWMNIWRSFHASKTLPALSQRAGPLTNSSLRCEHGLSLLSDQLRMISEGHCPKEAMVLGPLGDGLPQPELITETQWQSLNEFYGPGADTNRAQADEDSDVEIEQVVRAPPFTVSLAANAEGHFVWGPASCMECINKLKQKHVEENTDYTDRAVSIAVLDVGESVPNRPSVTEVSPDSKDSSNGTGIFDGNSNERRSSKRRRKGQTFMITASSSDTLVLIMLKISEKLISNYDGKQTVYLRGKELVGKDKTMKDHGVRCGDVLHVQVEDEKESGFDLGAADIYGNSRVESGFRGSFLSMDNVIKEDDSGLVELRKVCQDMGLNFKDHLISGAFTNAKGNIEVALSILTS